MVIIRVFVLVLLLIISAACKGANLPEKGVWVGCADCFVLQKILHSEPNLTPSAEVQPRADLEAVT